MLQIARYIFFILLCWGLFSCSNDAWNPDVSKVDIQVHIKRFEKSLFTVDTTTLENFERDIKKVETEYPEAYQAYTEHLLAIGPKDSFVTIMKLKKLISDSYWQNLYHDVEKKYDQKVIDSLNVQFTSAFQHLKYYYPKDTLPEIVTLVKGFNPYQVVPAIFTYENILGISLDNFMGADYKYYEGWPLYSDYQIRRFTPAYIVSNALKTIYSDKYAEEPENQTLLASAIYLGKSLFFLDAMAPDMADSLKIEYTTKQLKWANDNEGQIWQHFADNNLLFTTDQKKLAHYINDAPFTNADEVPTDAPPRLAEFLGWRIVHKYMENNPNVTLSQLMNENDSRKILKLAKYKPK